MPSVADLNRHNQQGRDSPANLTCHQQDSGHTGALRRWEPTRDNDRRVRKCPRFSGTEAKSRYQQKIVVPHHPGQRRESGPPEHHTGQHTPRANPVPQRTSGNLKQAVGQREHRRHPTPANGIDVQIVLYTGPRHRNTHAVEVHNRE